MRSFIEEIPDNELQQTFSETVDTLSRLSETTLNCLPKEEVEITKELKQHLKWDDKLDVIRLSPTPSLSTESVSTACDLLDGLMGDERAVPYPMERTHVGPALLEAFNNFCEVKDPSWRGTFEANDALERIVGLWEKLIKKVSDNGQAYDEENVVRMAIYPGPICVQESRVDSSKFKMEHFCSKYSRKMSLATASLCCNGR